MNSSPDRTHRCERVVLATDRYITYFEAVNRPRSIDYPFTVIELHINASGEGEGRTAKDRARLEGRA